jgi:hypothetical protein
MGRKFTLDGKDYDTDAVTPEARDLALRLAFAQERLQDLANQQALLIRARNAYILDLKTEIEGRAPGKVDASALLVSE